MKHAKPRGRGAYKPVKRRLADGTIKEYRYPRARYRKDANSAAPATGVIVKIIKAYKADPERKHDDLSEGWKEQLQGYFDLLEERFGWMTKAEIESDNARTDFWALRDELIATPRKCGMVMGLLYKLLHFGRKRGYLNVNQMDLVDPVKRNPNPRSDIIWTPDDEAALLAGAPPQITRPFRFALLTGAREGDIIRADRSWIGPDGWLVFTPSKTSKRKAVQVHLPVFALPPLAALLDELPAEGRLFRTERFDEPWASAQSFAVMFGRWTRKVFGRDVDLHFNDCRGTLITRLFEAGCTEQEVASISGHAMKGSLRRNEDTSRNAMRAYIARTRKLAENAYRKLWGSMGGASDNVVPLPRKGA